MSLSDELNTEVQNILNSSWNVRDARVVPSSSDVALSGGGARFDGTVLYSDLAQSSELATDFHARTAAKVLKSFVRCCVRVINEQGGTVTSFDGDRVMGIFVGDSKNTCAAIAALKINHVVSSTIRPQAQATFTSVRDAGFKITHATGVDTSSIFAVRAGQRGDNDIVWVGRAPNFAAKLCSIREDNFATYISNDVFARLSDEAKLGGNENKLMWESRSYKWMDKGWSIHRSSWTWKP
jgi:class 3 adenylate cyclase